MFVIAGGVISATKNVKIHVADVASAADCDRVTSGAYSAVSSHGPGNATLVLEHAR